MLLNAQAELTQLMDVCIFINMTRKQARNHFQIPPGVDVECRPFEKQRLKFKIDEKQTMIQNVLDYSSHIKALQKTLNQSLTRVAQIKA